MDTLVNYGSEIKSLGTTDDGAMKFGAWLVLYGDPTNTDASNLRDYFTKSTDFDIEDGDKTTVYWNHGLDPELKRRKLGTATLHKKDAGIWMEGILKARDEYEAKIQDMIKAGKLGASSGVPSHLVERKNVGGAHEILLWPLGKDASLTHTPAEWRTSAHALKSLEELEDVEPLSEIEPEIKRYDPRQPRDDHGKWTDSATGKLSVGHAIHVMKHEGITDEKHHEAVRAAIESGQHKSREDVLKHIDSLHGVNGTKAPKSGSTPAPEAPKDLPTKAPSRISNMSNPKEIAQRLSLPEDFYDTSDVVSHYSDRAGTSFTGSTSHQVNKKYATPELDAAHDDYHDFMQKRYTNDRWGNTVKKEKEARLEAAMADVIQKARAQSTSTSSTAATGQGSSATDPPKSKRLEVLEASLQKKEARFDEKIGAHFDSVREANGQPLNDKRNGQATMDKWERQNDSLRNLQKEIEKTKNAIDREKSAINRVESTRDNIPPQISALLDSGELTQWRKYPNTFFVAGVDKARIVLDEKTGEVAHRYTNQVTDPEQRKKLASVYNALSAQLNKPESGKPKRGRKSMDDFEDAYEDDSEDETDEIKTNLHTFTTPNEVCVAIHDILQTRMPLSWHAEAARTAVDSVAARLEGHPEVKAGRVISADNHRELDEACAALKTAYERLMALVEAHRPEINMGVKTDELEALRLEAMLIEAQCVLSESIAA